MTMPEQLEGSTSRAHRMMLWILRHQREMDDPKTKGKLQFDLGRGQGGQAEVSAAFHPAPERL